MLSIPYRRPGGWTFDLLLVLDQTGVDRLHAHDPAMVDCKKLGEPWRDLKLGHITIAYETTEDQAKLIALVKADKLQQVFTFVNRGFKYRPDLGDDDAAYLNISGKPS